MSDLSKSRQGFVAAALLVLSAIAAPSVAREAEGAAAQPASAETGAPREVIAWIEQNAIPLYGSAPTLPHDDLDKLIAATGSAKVIGFGEGSHGTKQFFQLRDRFVRRLAAKDALDAIVWETDHVPALAEEKKLADASVDLNDVKLMRSLWRTQENLELLAWLRETNANRPVSEQIRFYGADVFNLDAAMSYMIAEIRSEDGEAQAIATEISRLLPSCLKGVMCDEAMEAIGFREYRALAVLSAQLSRHFAANSYPLSARIAANTSEHRLRHLMQFAQLSPTSSIGDASIFETHSIFAEQRKAAVEAATRLENSGPSTLPLMGAEVSRLSADVPTWRRAYVDWNPADRYEVREIIAYALSEAVLADVDQPVIDDLEALQVYLDSLHEKLALPQNSDDFDNGREVGLGTNLALIAGEYEEGGRIVFAAHNGHVSTEGSRPIGRRSSGGYAKDLLGDDYVTIGMMFGTGTLRAYDIDAGDGSIKVFDIQEQDPESWEATFSSINREVFALDLRTIPADGSVREWFDVERPRRQIGNSYAASDPGAFYETRSLAKDFDIVIFVRTVDAAVPAD